MSGQRPFVVTVASEKGGVGKTTLATNLAVYLKALREELPVTILSFDNHFSVDNMFAIGRQRGRSVAGLFHGEPIAELVQLGEYGVQYLASERTLTPPEHGPELLRSVLAQSRLGGVLIVDTRPIIDYFTASALIAADLLLVPVKDRPSLMNAAAVLETFAAHGDAGSAWLVPSIIDARLRLRGDIGVREFLTFAARERGYQVLDTFIAKSPKVESLATGLSSRVYPVLTHARQTVVHQQLREIADFVLQRRDRAVAAGSPEREATLPPGRLRRLQQECPACGLPLGQQGVHFFHDQRSRRRGGIHPSCLSSLLGAAGDLAGGDAAAADLLLFDLGDAGLSAPAELAVIRTLDAAGLELSSTPSRLSTGQLEAFLQAACGRAPAEFFCERLFVSSAVAPLVDHLAAAPYRDFQQRRRQALRRFGTLLSSGESDWEAGDSFVDNELESI